MKKGLIGIQMSTIKDKINELGAYGTLKACAELGYHCVEVSQIPMTCENVAGMKKASEEFGIKIAACSAALEPMMPGMKGENLTDDFDKIVADCKELNCDMLRIGMLPMTCMGSREKALEFVKRADEMAARLKEHGIDLYYHNHHVEFIKYDGEYLLDIIKNSTKHMGFELDIHWIQRGGENPVEFIKKYDGRIRLLHLKDYRVGTVKMPEGAFDPKTFMDAFTSIIEFAEVGEGSLPIKECIEAGLAGGSEYFLIEQDDTYGRDSFESLKISRDNLIELGYGDWFEL
ncbi:MAG: sugar phosphate isomerase/epimerase [Faecalicatena sp.]|uniref:sugar phosphate isomerase/epimerase family protein n=1 Tax=Faecalicatena sp. TaxID=2005360 RepID=UPI002588AAB3|nr:sugar phosphate isomerase/epimerase [Faecalicatena sp.]MCI6465477.1 sugar phosphate isomerase/epimerase [Faecalicatena sp.]MDY5617309.1 sugar phosphate isomerase/epimerase [Lachnospiraceae bacterium]